MSLSPGPSFRLIPYSPDLKANPEELREGTALFLDGPDSVCDRGLECLDGFDGVWGIHLQNARKYNIRALARLRGLRYLGLINPPKDLDCTQFADLEWLQTDWTSGMVLPGADSRLKRLHLYGVAAQDLALMPRWQRLEVFEIVASRITALTGIERWPALTALACLRLARLRSIEAIAACTRLESVLFESCAELGDIAALGDAPALRQLAMGKCGAIDSLAFADRSSSLREIRLVKTWVRDGNMLPLLRMEVAVFDYKPYYSHSEVQIANLRSRRG